MIKKTIISALLILMLYNIYVSWHLSNVTISRNQSQDNTIRAQKFIYSDSVYKNVIVGSSLSNHLPMDSLPGFYNLSFSNQSVFDGLKILSLSKHLPHTIFIEMNVILKTETESFTGALENPLLHYSRKYIMAMRDGKQPLDVSSVYLEKLAFSNSTVFSKGDIFSTGSSKLTNNFLSTGIEMHVKSYAQPPDSVKMEQAIAHLKTYVKEFEGRKVKIVFFEMPVNPIVNRQVYPQMVRNKIFEAFPPSKYKYIFQPDCSSYQTTDGVHMNGKEVSMYVHYFKSSL